MTTVDRVVDPSLDSVVALALAAVASTDLALVTNILLAPLYPPAVLAKQLASVAYATGNRLVIGIAVGARETTTPRPASTSVSVGTSLTTR